MCPLPCNRDPVRATACAGAERGCYLQVLLSQQGKSLLHRPAEATTSGARVAAQPEVLSVWALARRPAGLWAARWDDYSRPRIQVC